MVQSLRGKSWGHETRLADSDQITKLQSMLDEPNSRDENLTTKPIKALNFL